MGNSLFGSTFTDYVSNTCCVPDTGLHVGENRVNTHKLGPCLQETLSTERHRHKTNTVTTNVFIYKWG